jgi:hypothetical protein
MFITAPTAENKDTIDKIRTPPQTTEMTKEKWLTDIRPIDLQRSTEMETVNENCRVAAR